MPQSQHRSHAIRRINRWSIATDALLATIKTLAGIFGHSQALIMDGLHSLSDLATDFLVHGFHKVSMQAPDDDHPYGHGRFETLGTLIFAIILLAVSGGFIWEALSTSSTAVPTPEWYTLGVAALALSAKEALFRVTLRWGEKLNAPLLIANAWHHRSDVLSTVAVIVGVAGAKLGYPSADTIAAIVVGLFIAHMAGKLLWQSVSELVDTTPYQKQDHLIKAICSVPGVRNVHALRSRKMGPHTLVDVHIEVPATISVSDGHRIADEVIHRLKQKFSDIADVTVHVDAEPDDKQRPSSGLPNRDVVAQTLNAIWHDLPGFEKIMGVQIHYLGGQVHCDVIFPLSCVTDDREGCQSLLGQYQTQAKQIPWLGDINFLFASDAVQLHDALRLHNTPKRGPSS